MMPKDTKVRHLGEQRNLMSTGARAINVRHIIEAQCPLINGYATLWMIVWEYCQTSTGEIEVLLAAYTFMR